MAMERRRLQDPPPRYKSGPRRRRPTTDKGHLARMRVVLSGQANTLIALLNKQRGGKIQMATTTMCVEAVLLRRMAPVTATPALSVISVLTWLNSPWLHHVATSSAGHACSSGSMHSHPSLSGLSARSRYWWKRTSLWYMEEVVKKVIPPPTLTCHPPGRRQQMVDTRRQLIQN
jgi:hypothetical protein